MPTVTVDRAEEIIARWRSGLDMDGWENPAGPLYASGVFAEGDIVTANVMETRCSSCSASGGGWCC